MLRAILLATFSALSAIAPAVAAESDLSRYRGLTLGDSVAAVVARLAASPADVKVLLAQPALVQELTWRPLRFVSGAITEPDAVTEMVLTFHLDRLARIVVVYDRERTAGMTDADLQEALGAVYGASSLPSNPSWTTLPLMSDRKVIGIWESPGARLLLWHDLYPEHIGITIIAIAADAALRASLTEAARVDAATAPARELARRAAEATVKREREEKIRQDNKAAFKP